MREDIIKIISRELVEQVDNISENTKIEDIAKDSLDVVGLVAALSGEYDIKIKPEDLSGIKTVGDIISFIEKHKGKEVHQGTLRGY